MCGFFRNCREQGHDLELPLTSGAKIKGDICKKHYQALWQQALISEHGSTAVNVPLDNVRGADQYLISLVAVRNDPDYLSKSFVYTVYGPGATATPLRLLRNRVTKKILKATSHMTDQEIATAKRKTPKDADDNPTMGHTYLLLQARSGNSGVALYSFGYFPTQAGVENPDRHVRLANEQRRSVDYLVDRAQWDRALDEIFEWRWAHVTKAASYALMGHNCTAFARAVLKAAGKKFLGESIPTFTSAGLSKAYTPNRTFKALKSKKRHQQWDTGVNNPVHLNAANASELHHVFFGGDEED